MSTRPTHELFDVAVGTKSVCARYLGDKAEAAITPLAVAAFQLQAAWTGVRLAEMCTRPDRTEFLREVAIDYDGASSSSLNLAVRCSVTVVDLCAEALGCLVGIPKPGGDRYRDAGNWLRPRNSMTTEDDDLQRLASWFLDQLETDEWRRMQDLRDQVTHKVFNRTVYMTAGAETSGSLARKHIDIHVQGEQTPLDELARSFVSFAENVWWTLCERLADLDDSAE